MCWNESPSFSVLKHWSLINPSQNFWIEKVILFSTVLWIFFHWLSGRIQVFCKKTFTFLKMRKFWRKFIVSFPLIFLKYSLKDWKLSIPISSSDKSPWRQFSNQKNAKSINENRIDSWKYSSALLRLGCMKRNQLEFSFLPKSLITLITLCLHSSQGIFSD